MDEGDKRPGGLTALAVFNFIGAGFSVLAVLFMMVGLALRDSIPTRDMTPEQIEQFEQIKSVTMPQWVLVMAMSSLIIILLFISGVGYLQRKKVMGRLVGNLYALVSIGKTLLFLVALPPALGGEVGWGLLVSFIYPVLTLLLVNGVYKKELVREGKGDEFEGYLGEEDELQESV